MVWLLYAVWPACFMVDDAMLERRVSCHQCLYSASCVSHREESSRLIRRLVVDIRRRPR